MKAIASGDLHIDINNRFEDTKAVLRQMATYAIQNKIEKFWILGDVYNKKRPYNSEKVLFNKFVKSLTNNNIEVTIISGNHDVDKLQVSALDDLGVWNLPNVKLLPNPSVIPFGVDNIYLGHFLVAGAKLGALNYSMPHAVDLDWILKTPASLYLLGDVHKAQVLHKKPDVLYVGSPERVDFGERDEIKGFTLIEDRGDGLSYKFVPLKTRPMIQYDYTVGNPIDMTKNYIDAIVKIKITCTKEQYKEINEKEIRESFKEAHSLKIEYNILIEERVRNSGVSEGCSPAIAFKNYAKEIGLDANILNLGLTIIGEA